MKDTKKLAFMGVMLAVTIVLMSLPIGGMILIGSVSVTIAHIPTIITGIALGPVAGLVMGALFGASTLIRALVAGVSPVDLLFINPLISILPRMTIGIASYYGYTLSKLILNKIDKRGVISSAVGAALGSLSNTVFVLMMLYLLYAKNIIEAVGGSFKVFLISVVSINATVEVILSTVITIPIVLAYKKMNKR